MPPLSDVRWPYILMAIFGIFINVVFIRATTKTRTRRVVTSTSITVACIIATVNGIQLLVRCILDMNKQLLSGCLLETILDAVVFLADGSYLWILVIINVSRCQVLKDNQHPRNHITVSRKTNKFLIAALFLSFLFTLAYGVLIYFSNTRSTENTPTVIQVFHAVAKEVPLTMITCLHIFILGKSFILMWTRRHKTTEMNRLLHQNIFYLILGQTFTFVIPGSFVYGVEFMAFHIIGPVGLNIGPLLISYWTVKHLMVIFNPVNFGMLLSPRRGFVLSCLGCDKSSKEKAESTDVSKNNAMRMKAIQEKKTDGYGNVLRQLEKKIKGGDDVNSTKMDLVPTLQTSQSAVSERFIPVGNHVPLSNTDDGDLDESIRTSAILYFSKRASPNSYTADQIFFKDTYPVSLQDERKSKTSTVSDGHTAISESTTSTVSDGHTPMSVSKLSIVSYSHTPMSVSKLSTVSQSHSPMSVSKLSTVSHSHTPMSVSKLSTVSNGQTPMSVSKISTVSHSHTPISVLTDVDEPELVYLAALSRYENRKSSKQSIQHGRNNNSSRKISQGNITTCRKSTNSSRSISLFYGSRNNSMTSLSSYDSDLIDAISYF